MVLICNSPDKAEQLLAGLSQKQDWAQTRSAARIAALTPQASALTWDALQQEPRYQAARKAALTLAAA
jgi:beta-N-acetylhexosaminidase